MVPSWNVPKSKLPECRVPKNFEQVDALQHSKKIFQKKFGYLKYELIFFLYKFTECDVFCVFELTISKTHVQCDENCLCVQTCTLILYVFMLSPSTLCKSRPHKVNSSLERLEPSAQSNPISERQAPSAHF